MQKVERRTSECDAEALMSFENGASPARLPLLEHSVPDAPHVDDEAILEIDAELLPYA